MDAIIILLALISVPLALISAVTYFILPFYIFKMNKRMIQIANSLDSIALQLQFMEAQQRDRQ